MLSATWATGDSKQEHRIMANVIGKRYLCPICNSEMIVTKGSPNGQLACCGQPMQLKQ